MLEKMHNGRTYFKSAVLTAAVFLVSFFSPGVSNVHADGCGAGQTGDGKACMTLTCSYWENGMLESISCTTSIYAINNTHTCCCDIQLVGC